MPRKTKPSIKNYIERIEEEVNTNQSKINLVLGGLIVLVVGVLIFNYFNKNKGGETQSQKTETQGKGDVSPENLPGKYTIKEGDSLFALADKYYKDGYKYPEIAKANNITNPDLIEVGQTIDIPKLEMQSPAMSPTPTQTQSGSPADTQWGPAISSDKYTVLSGDWLSKIAGRAYGDIMMYEKIAKANNIQNPDLIEPGTVLTIPK